MTSSKKKQVMEDFIEVYKTEKCLWQIKSKSYHNRNKRDAACLRLLEVLKELDPLASKEMVVKKINNLRTSYRKELKKVKASSCKSGSGADEVYIPTLWYFPLLSFLNDQEVPRNSNCNIEDDDSNKEADTVETIVVDCDADDIDDDWALINSASTSNNNHKRPNHQTEGSESPKESAIGTDNPVEPSSTITANTQTSCKRNRPSSKSSKLAKEQTVLSNEVLLSVKDHFKSRAAQQSAQNTEDRYDIFGKNVAMKLRDLQKQQRIIAEKIINETLFEAEMGTLSVPHSNSFGNRQYNTISPSNKYHEPIPSSSLPFNLNQNTSYPSQMQSCSFYTTPTRQQYTQNSRSSSVDSAATLFSNFTGE